MGPEKKAVITCTICEAPFSEDEGGVEGAIGLIPVQFCPFCFSGLADMFKVDEE